MSFWDEYTEVAGGAFVSAEEKATLASNGVVFEITGVSEEKGGKYGDRFLTKIMLPNPLTGEDEERILGFGKGTVTTRDAMLEALTGYLGSNNPVPVMVKLEKAGQAYLIRKAA